MFAYVGSFTYNGAQGITICDFDPENGKITPIKLTAKGINAGSLTVHNGFLYSTDEQIMSCPEGGGGVLTYALDPNTGEMTEKSHTFTMAANTSGITFSADGKYMIVTHFAIGMPSIKIIADGDRSWHSEKVLPDTITSLYKMNGDGTPGALCDVYIHKTAGRKPSFIHKAFLSSDGSCFAYGNLGSDLVGMFRIDEENDRLIMFGETECKDGSGPRHLVFHPTMPYLYLNYERYGVISKFRWDEYGCRWEADTPVVPEGVEMQMTFNQSEILINKNGDRLYNVMRGLGMIYVLEIDQKSGDLHLLQTLPTESKVVRGAVISPDGRFLLAACNDTEQVITYRIKADGTLEQASVSEHIAHPASIVFAHKDQKQAPPMDIEDMKRKAAAGDPQAMEILGEEYLHGNSVSQDFSQAFYWSAKAAETGRTRAMTNLGIMYMTGQGAQADIEKARTYFEKASDAGDMKAPRYLGLMFREKKIASDNGAREAIKYFLIGAERGDITSQYYLGEAYEYGVGIEKNMDEAVRWYRISAQRGDKIAKPAMDALARLGLS